MCCFPGLFHFVERIRGDRPRVGNGAPLALLVFMRGLLNTLRANLHDPLLVPVDQMLMHGVDSKDIRTRFQTYGFSVLMRVASVRSTCSTAPAAGLASVAARSDGASLQIPWRLTADVGVKERDCVRRINRRRYSVNRFPRVVRLIGAGGILCVYPIGEIRPPPISNVCPCVVDCAKPVNGSAGTARGATINVSPKGHRETVGCRDRA
jgi:hypothetical protein